MQDEEQQLEDTVKEGIEVSRVDEEESEEEVLGSE